jgi:hypothetical protein
MIQSLWPSSIQPARLPTSLLAIKQEENVHRNKKNTNRLSICETTNSTGTDFETGLVNFLKS